MTKEQSGWAQFASLGAAVLLLLAVWIGGGMDPGAQFSLSALIVGVLFGFWSWLAGRVR